MNLHATKKKVSKRVAPLTKTIHGRRVSVCDFKGICVNKAYQEVYPMLFKKKHTNDGWSYLCRKHFEQEQRRFNGKLPHSSID